MPRSDTKVVDLAYVAGIIDGEGSIIAQQQ